MFKKIYETVLSQFYERALICHLCKCVLIIDLFANVQNV